MTLQAHSNGGASLSMGMLGESPVSAKTERVDGLLAAAFLPLDFFLAISGALL